jgi:hypothetical protein
MPSRMSCLDSSSRTPAANRPPVDGQVAIDEQVVPLVHLLDNVRPVPSLDITSPLGRGLQDERSDLCTSEPAVDHSNEGSYGQDKNGK